MYVIFSFPKEFAVSTRHLFFSMTFLFTMTHYLYGSVENLKPNVLWFSGYSSNYLILVQYCSSIWYGFFINSTASTQLLLDSRSNLDNIIHAIIVVSTSYTSTGDNIPVLDIIYESLFPINNIGQILLLRLSIYYNYLPDLNNFCRCTVTNIVRFLAIPDNKITVVVEEY